MKVLRYGEQAMLLEFDSLEQVMSAHRTLRQATDPAITELVPAARTLLVTIETPLARRSLMERLDTLLTAAPSTESPCATGEFIIDIRYDGPDLAPAADQLGISTEALIDWHSSTVWTSAFIGFAPGFAYLACPDPRPVARHATPRTSVPAGAVGLAAEFCGIYPRNSPGGWQLLGTTTVQLWDEHATPPALLSPGTTVRFRPVA